MQINADHIPIPVKYSMFEYAYVNTGPPFCLLVSLHSALFDSPIAYEYKSTCLLVQKYFLPSTERVACSYKTRGMLDEVVV